MKITLLITISLLFGSLSVLFAQEDEFVTDVRNIQEVVVRSSSTQTVLDLYSINILDYRVYGQDILTLKKSKNQYYIGIEYADKLNEGYLLDIKKPRSIFSDCMNNVYILTDENAYQFIIKEDKVEIISVLNLPTFKANVKSCVGDFNDGLLVQRYTDYNKGYKLDLYNKKIREKKTIYKTIDSIALWNYIDLVAPDRRLRITQNSQMRRVRKPQFAQFRGGINQLGEDHNVVPTGLQKVYYVNNRNLLRNFPPLPSYQSPSKSSSFLGSNHFYNDAFFNSIVEVRNHFNLMLMKNMYNKKIEVNTFQLSDENFVVLNRFERKIYIYNQKGELKSEEKFDFQNKIIEVKFDPYTKNIYFTSKTDNLFKVHRLNIEDGSTHYVGGFKNIMFAKSIKIFDGWIYYRVMKNDYYKLYRTRLRS